MTAPFNLESLSNMYSDGRQKSILSEHLEFFYKVLEATLDACIQRKYSVFDGYTTSNCCHGVALLAMNLLQDITPCKAIKIKNDLSGLPKDSIRISQNLMCLCQLYILHMVKAKCSKRSYITDSTNLKTIFPLSKNFFSRLTNFLQKYIANLVATRYPYYLEKIPEDAKIHGQPLRLWGQYTTPLYSKTSSLGITYVSNLFSMRVTLSYLSFNRNYVSLINDVIDENDLHQYRYVALYLGDGRGGFQFICSSETKNLLEKLREEASVFVLGGVAYLNSFNKEAFLSDMKAWENSLQELVLACDMWYPQFPVVAGDPMFDSAPIIPKENGIQEILNYWGNVKGVQAEDSSLCCLTHIYPASLKEILAELCGNHILAKSFLPKNKRFYFENLEGNH